MPTLEAIVLVLLGTASGDRPTERLLVEVTHRDVIKGAPAPPKCFAQLRPLCAHAASLHQPGDLIIHFAGQARQPGGGGLDAGTGLPQ